VSNRRAQDERIEGTPDGVNAISEIVDVPDAPTMGTATAGLGSVSVAFTPATTGGTASLYTAISNPGAITGTSATSPITVSGLTAGTNYTFTVRGSNSTGTGPYSSASNSISPADLVNGYDALYSTTVPSGGAALISFSGIPQGYAHLQLRMTIKNTGSSSTQYIYPIRFNGDTAANYSSHYINANGSTVAASGNANQSGFNFYFDWPANISNTFGIGIMDILDYADTDKFKTIRTLTGFDANGSGQLAFNSSAWRSTNAIDSISFAFNADSFAQHTEFSLYGVK
jgi:hypothetical protein